MCIHSDKIASFQSPLIFHSPLNFIYYFLFIVFIQNIYKIVFCFYKYWLLNHMVMMGFECYLIFLFLLIETVTNIQRSKVKHLDTEEHSKERKHWVIIIWITEGWHMFIIFLNDLRGLFLSLNIVNPILSNGLQS